MNTEKNKEVLTREMSIKEYFRFRKRYNKRATIEEVENSEPVLESLEDGRLSGLDEDEPKYRLEEKLLTEDGEVFLEVIEFNRKRIKPTQMASLAKGIDPQKNGIEFSLRCIAFIIGQPVAVLDKLSKEDFNFLQEFTVNFM